MISLSLPSSTLDSDNSTHLSCSLDASKDEIRGLDPQEAEETGIKTETTETRLAAAILDATVLAELQGTIGEDLLAEIITTYLNYAPGQITKLKEAVERNNLTTLARLTHAFKSSSRSVGANRLGQLCDRAEGLSREGNSPLIRELWPAMEAEFHQVMWALKQFLSR